MKRDKSIKHWVVFCVPRCFLQEIVEREAHLNALRLGSIHTSKDWGIVEDIQELICVASISF
jgi:hypothetical protein